MAQISTVADWAPYISISLFLRLISFVRSTMVMLVVDNPLSWRLGFRGTRNPNDDIEGLHGRLAKLRTLRVVYPASLAKPAGPFYILGSPRRDIADGKAVLAPKEMLNKEGPFLLIVDIKDTKGDPVPNASVDAWHADSVGEYYFASWTLRGKMTADEYGRLEILTIRPADYGKRAGHVHLRVSGVRGKHAPMTTQAYVCPGNNKQHMNRYNDVAGYMRKTPYQNMATFWSISAANGGKKFHNFPEFPRDDIEAADILEQWNERTKAHGIGRDVVAVGRHELRLTLL